MSDLQLKMDGNYTVSIGRHLLKSENCHIEHAVTQRRVLIVTTPTVYDLYGDYALELLSAFAGVVKIIVIDVDESKKTMESVLGLCERVKQAGLGRRDVMVALGGGVLSDLVRTTASLVRRGIDHICIPTTLIGQIDAAIGVKAGVNFDGTKSYLGVFYAPKTVAIDIDLLRTLPPLALRDGMAEILKLAMSLDSDLFEQIELFGPDLIRSGFANPAATAEHVIRRAATLTLDELRLDLYERGTLKRLLDFGHTFSPLIESVHDFTLTHGHAVAIDMCISSAISVELGLIDHSVFQRILDTLQAVGLPCDDDAVDVTLLQNALDAAARHRDGAPNLVVPDRIGSAVFVERRHLSPHVLTNALHRLRTALAPLAVYVQRPFLAAEAGEIGL